MIRVAKPHARVVIDELYTHQALQKLRESVVGQKAYAIVRPHIYHGQKPYITEDERKINESEFDKIRGALLEVECTYFNMIVNRFAPDWDPLEIIDRIAMRCRGSAGRLFAGRILLTGLASK